MNKNVSANRLAQIASEIEYKTGIAEENIRKLQKDINEIIQKSNKLQSFDGTGVSGSTNYIVGEKDANGNIPVTHTWSIWSIKGPSEKKSAAGELNRKLANVLVVLQNLTRLARQMQGSADDIITYESIIEGLDWKDNDPLFASSFALLAGHIAYDEYSAAEGKYERIDPNSVKYWTDKPLKFEKDETTGSYKVLQQDENGNWVAMGFTDETTANTYKNYFTYQVVSSGMLPADKEVEKKKKDTLKMRDDSEKENKNNNVHRSLSDFMNAVGKEARNFADSVTNGLNNVGGGVLGGVFAGLSGLASNFANGLGKLGTIGGEVSNVTTSYSYGDKVANAKVLYADELENAYKKYDGKNMLAYVFKKDIGGHECDVTHIVYNNSEQMFKGIANDEYGSGRELPTSIARRTGAIVTIDGAHFSSNGRQDINVATNTVAITHGDVVDTARTGLVNEGNRESALQATAGGNEICITKDGEMFTAPRGTTVQSLLDQGVVETYSSHDIPLIENGQKVDYGTEEFSNALDKVYPRNVIAQTEEGDVYIITGKTSNRATQDYLYDLGCTYGKSMDQGGSTALVFEGELVNTPTDETGERPMGDTLCFSDK